MAKRFGIIIVLFLMTSSAASAEQEQGPYALAGLEGPILQIQGFATALLGYHINDHVEVGAYASVGGQSFSTPGHSGQRTSGQIWGLPISIFPLPNQKNFLSGSMIRIGLAYQNMILEKCVENCDKLEGQEHQAWLDGIQETSWRTKSYGLEIAPGYKYQNLNFIAEFLPVTYFKPIRKNISGQSSGNDVVELRMLTWRAGYRF